jgi:hypothetical protein
VSVARYGSFQKYDGRELRYRANHGEGRVIT